MVCCALVTFAVFICVLTRLFLLTVGVNLTLTSGNGNDVISIQEIGGSVDLTSANGEDYIDVIDVGGICTISSAAGNDNVTLTEVQGSTTIRTGGGNDTVRVNSVQGYLDIDSGFADDKIYLFTLGDDATIYGNSGNDELFLDARGPNGTNIMDGSTLDWNGGADDDNLEMYFVSSGTTDLNVVGDNMGVNQLITRCSDEACTVLSRRTFLANIHQPGDINSSLERINIAETASITSLLLYLQDGENSVHFDDTIAQMVGCSIRAYAFILHILHILIVSFHIHRLFLVETTTTHSSLAKCSMTNAMKHMECIRLISLIQL